jgi:hypothetical protein
MPADPQRRDQPERRNENVIAFKKRSMQGENNAIMPRLDPEEDKRRIRSNVAALIFAALLVFVGIYLVRVLAEKSRLEDCLMSGRNNCMPIEAPSRQD